MVRAFLATEAFEIEGDEYKLFMDIGVIDAIEDAIDMGFTDFMAGLGKGSVKAGKMSKVFLGLLAAKQPSITLNEVGALYFAHGAEMMTAFEQLCVKAWPEQAEQVKGENPPKAHRGTGGNSSSNGARKGSRQATSGSKPPAP